MIGTTAAEILYLPRNFFISLSSSLAQRVFNNGNDDFSLSWMFEAGALIG